MARHNFMLLLAAQEEWEKTRFKTTTLPALLEARTCLSGEQGGRETPSHRQEFGLAMCISHVLEFPLDLPSPQGTIPEEDFGIIGHGFHASRSQALTLTQVSEAMSVVMTSDCMYVSLDVCARGYD